MSGTPLISVLLPVRNEAATIDETLGSILGQTLGDFEVIVVDDGSTDGTAGRVERIGDPRVRVLHMARPVGITQALNEGAAVARGTFLVRHDAGDTSDSTRFQKQCRLLLEEPDVGVVGTWCSDVLLGGLLVVREVPTGVAEILDVARRHRSIPICHGSVMMRTVMFREVGGYRLFPAAQDQDLWWRLSERTEIANIPESLYAMRARPGGLSVHKRPVQFWCAYAAFVLAERRRRGEPDPLGSSPTESEVARFVARLRRDAPAAVRNELCEKLFNLGCAARSQGHRAAALRAHGQYLTSGGAIRRVAAFWLRQIVGSRPTQA